MPAEKWLVRWKKNRNHRGEEIFSSREEAINFAEEKRQLGYKLTIKKLPRRTPPQSQ